MKTNQLNKVLTTIGAIALLSIGSNALAQRGLDRLPDDLELTEEQREQLTALRDEQREEARAQSEQRREAGEAQREAMQAEAEEHRAAQQARLAEILTPEQMTKLEENRAAALEQREARMARMNEMGPRDGNMRNQRAPGGQGPGAGPRRGPE